MEEDQMAGRLAHKAVTFDLSSPIRDQVRPRGRPLLRRTHNFKSAAVSLIRVISAVVLLVAGQCGVDAASCVKASRQLVRDQRRTESFSSFNLWIENKAIYAPLSHWNWSLHSTGGSLHSVAEWQGLSCVSSTSQAEPPNWDGVWTDRVRNCGQACNSDLNSLTLFDYDYHFKMVPMLKKNGVLDINIMKYVCVCGVI